jgi:hypothetical protein
MGVKWDVSNTYIYANYVNLLREHINITKDKIESLLVASKDVALQVNTEGKPDTPAGILFMSRHQNAGQIHNIIITNKLYENVEKMKCLRTTVKSENYTHEKKMRTG